MRFDRRWIALIAFLLLIGLIVYAYYHQSVSYSPPKSSGVIDLPVNPRHDCTGTCSNSNGGSFTCPGGNFACQCVCGSNSCTWEKGLCREDQQCVAGGSTEGGCKRKTNSFGS